jgi:hypothetical protein
MRVGEAGVFALAHSDPLFATSEASRNFGSAVVETIDQK